MPSAFRRIALVLALVAAAGCGWLKPQPIPILPAEELYQQGETQLNEKRYEDARKAFTKIVERHPNSSYAPRARFLLGEAYYRDAEVDKAIKEFETFLSFYPRHQIADLVQYRLAMAYYDQIKPIEQDQTMAKKSLDAFKMVIKQYPESRYATDSLAKIDVCRGRLAQKEVWVAAYYINQGNPAAARQRLEYALKEFPRTMVIPEALWMLADIRFREGRAPEATELLRRLATEYPFTEWGRRAGQRLQQAQR